MFMYFENCFDLSICKSKKQTLGRLSKNFIIANNLNFKDKLRVRILFNKENKNQFGLCFDEKIGIIVSKLSQFYISKNLNINPGKYKLIKNKSDFIGDFFIIEKIEE